MWKSSFLSLHPCAAYPYRSRLDTQTYYAPGLKGLPGHRIDRPSVRNSVPVTNTSKLQYLKFGWWYSNQTWTVSSSMGSSHYIDIKCPWGGAGSNVGPRDFDIFWLCCRQGRPCFTNTAYIISAFLHPGRVNPYRSRLDRPKLSVPIISWHGKARSRLDTKNTRGATVTGCAPVVSFSWKGLY